MQPKYWKYMMRFSYPYWSRRAWGIMICSTKPGALVFQGVAPENTGCDYPLFTLLCAVCKKWYPRVGWWTDKRCPRCKRYAEKQQRHAQNYGGVARRPSGYYVDSEGGTYKIPE